MGEGLCRSDDGRTVYIEPYEGLDPEDRDLWSIAHEDLVAAIRAQLSDARWTVEREWRGRTECVIARNGLHEI